MARAISDSRLVISRDFALATLREKLADAILGLPRFVLVEGEPGMGKTTLLDGFIGETVGAVTLRASGDELETSLRYGIIEQLCRTPTIPLPSTLASLSGSEAASVPPHAIGSALLDVVGDLQSRSPVVLVVDDAHLADEPSLHALQFLLRRLRSERILVVLCAPPMGTALVAPGLRTMLTTEAGTKLHLTGFDDQEIRQLGFRAGGAFSRSAIAQLRDQTGGNPMLLQSLLEEMGVRALERVGHDPPPAPQAFNLVVHPWISACSPEARRLVGTVAVVGMHCEFGLARRLAALDEPLSALQAAVDAGLVEFRERQVCFSHPLLRAAVYHALGIAERAEFHRQAARFSDDTPSKLRHLAAAATEEDEELAATMADFARTEVTRGAVSSAATLFQDAGRLAPGGPARERHLLDAVECLLVGGDVAAARPLSVGLETYSDASRGHCLLGLLARLGGRTADAEQLIRRALELSSPSSAPVLAVEAADELAALHTAALRPTEAEAWAKTMTSALSNRTDVRRQLPQLALVLVLTGQTPEAVSIFSDLPEGDEPAEKASLLLGRSIVRMYAAALMGSNDDAARLMRWTSRRSDAYLHVCALMMLALTEYRLGAWQDSVTHARLGLTITEEMGLESPRSTLHALAVWPLAGLARWEEAEAHASWAASAVCAPWDQAMTAIARAALARARGRHVEVLDAITTLRALGAPGALDEPDGFWPWQELYIDACLVTGRVDDAVRELDHFERLAAARSSVGATASAARLRGNVEMAQGRPEEANTAFRRALSMCSTLVEPYQHGLIHLAYGAYLRRIGARSAAEAELRIGQNHFGRLGARVGLESCEREMAANGRVSPKRRPAHSTALTSQETSISSLVAQGKTNRIIAADLMISVNTVEYHLKNIYARLGITSRSQLILRLGTVSTVEAAKN